MNAEQAKALREPFKPEQIGKLPRGGTQLDYVGHAAVTDRLLQVDSGWSWEPVATDPHTGAPLIVDKGLWIKLTVCGVTRYGYGDATGAGGIKEMIGDAIRNAAMRFGVGLDLWAKEDLRAEGEAGPEGTPAAVPPPGHEQDGPTPDDPDQLERRRKRMFALAGELDAAGVPFPEGTPEDMGSWDEWTSRFALGKFGRHSRGQLTLPEVNHIIDLLERESVPFS